MEYFGQICNRQHHKKLPEKHMRKNKEYFWYQIYCTTTEDFQNPVGFGKIPSIKKITKAQTNKIIVIISINYGL